MNLVHGRFTGLEASRAPYSKSHARILRRKEREQIAGGSLESLVSAISHLESNGHGKTGETDSAAGQSRTDHDERPSSTVRPCKGTHLKQSARRQALYVLFIPYLLSPGVSLLFIPLAGRWKSSEYL